MTWTDRQRAMLAEMGVLVWAPREAESGLSAVPEPPQLAPVSAAAEVSVAKRMTPVPPVVPVVPVMLDGGAATGAEVPTSHGTRPSGLEQMDWDALQQAVSACTACSLCAGRTQTVFGVGSRQAHWLIVGEAPGEQEDRQGEPFVGKSGQLLDNMLRAIQCTRREAVHDDADDLVSDPAHQVYIANTIKCRPPGNRNPAPAELAQCEPYLIRQIELLRPRIILAMGRFAVQSLLRSTEPIGRLRGRVHAYQGVPLIVTYHPAYLLRNPEDKAKAWDDLRLAVRVAKSAPAVL